MRTHITRTGCEDPPIKHMCAYARTDIRIAYSVETKYAFRNYTSNAVLARVPTHVCRRLWLPVTLKWLHMFHCIYFCLKGVEWLYTLYYCMINTNVLLTYHETWISPTGCQTQCLSSPSVSRECSCRSDPLHHNSSLCQWQMDRQTNGWTDTRHTNMSTYASL